jgi:hypothetical protein
MPCPRCGGLERLLIAPGYYQCKTSRIVSVPGPGFGAPPTGQFGPQFVNQPIVCNAMYQEGSAAMQNSPLCACGRFVIGLCLECHSWVCGFCSITVNDRLICRKHEVQREEERRRAEEITAKRSAEERAQALAMTAELAHHGTDENPGSLDFESKSPYSDGVRNVTGVLTCWALGLTVLVVLTAAGTGPAPKAELPYLFVFEYLGKPFFAWWAPLLLGSVTLVVRLFRPKRNSMSWLYQARFGSNLAMTAYGVFEAWSFIHGHNATGSGTGTGGAILLGGVFAIPFGIYFFFTSVG